MKYYTGDEPGSTTAAQWTICGNQRGRCPCAQCWTAFYHWHLALNKKTGNPGIGMLAILQFPIRCCRETDAVRMLAVWSCSWLMASIPQALRTQRQQPPANKWKPRVCLSATLAL